MMVGKREGNHKLIGDINHVAVDTKQETGRTQLQQSLKQRLAESIGYSVMPDISNMYCNNFETSVLL